MLSLACNLVGRYFFSAVVSLVRGTIRTGTIPFLILLSLALVSFKVRAATPESVPETLDRLQFGRDLWTTRVEPLGLKGMSGRNAINTLMADGYACSVHARASIPDFDFSPRVRCSLRSAEYAHICDRFDVTLFFFEKSLPPSQQANLPSQSEFVEQLATRMVLASDAMCIPTTALPVYFAIHRAQGERVLRDQVEVRKYVGMRLDKVHDQLVIEGYRCGLDHANRETNAAKSSPHFVCTLVAPDIKYCFEAELRFTVDWSSGKALWSELIQQMPNTKVRGVNSRCIVRALRGGQPE